MIKTTGFKSSRVRGSYSLRPEIGQYLQNGVRWEYGRITGPTRQKTYDYLRNRFLSSRPAIVRTGYINNVFRR